MQSNKTKILITLLNLLLLFALIDCSRKTDGIVAPTTADSDKDGLADDYEIKIGSDPYNADTDGDTILDGDEINCKNRTYKTSPILSDTDGDGLIDSSDSEPSVEKCTNPSPSKDDLDSDGILDDVDNCPSVSNTEQVDTDGDGVGDLCDNCKESVNPFQEDIDEDGVGTVCDADEALLDDDGDGKINGVDNCLTISNPDQSDVDADQIGDLCDNCIDISNPEQADDDNDGTGNLCESENVNPSDTDGDGINNDQDNCPNNSNSNQLDSDNDGIGNACDSGDSPNGDGPVNITGLSLLGSDGSNWASNIYVTSLAFGHLVKESSGIAFSAKYEATKNLEMQNENDIILSSTFGPGHNNKELVVSTNAGNGENHIFIYKNGSMIPFKSLKTGSSSTAYPRDVAIGKFGGIPVFGAARYITTDEQERVKIYKSTGNRYIKGNGSNLQLAQFIDGSSASSTAFGDIDGDGVDEIIVGRMMQSGNGDFTSNETQRWFVYDNEGNMKACGGGNVNTSCSYSLAGLWGKDSSVTVVASDDLDNDGKDEVLIGRKGGSADGNKLLVYEFKNTPSVLFAKPLADDGYIIDIATGTIAGIGKVVGVATSASDFNTDRVILYNAEGGIIGRISDWVGWSQVTSLAFGDINNDGSDELLVGRLVDPELGTNHPRWLLYTATYDAINNNIAFDVLFQGGGNSNIVDDPDWPADLYVTEVAMGDFDGDGMDEIAIGRNAGGNNVPKLLIYDPVVGQ